MPEPSLRELLLPFKDCNKDVRQAVYALLEAVFEAFETLEPEDTDATIRKLRQRAEVAESREAVEPKEPAYIYAPMLNATLQEVGRLRDRLAEAKAQTKRARTQRDEAISGGEFWVKECHEAKAEIERLTAERDSAELKLGALHAIDKRILADAELGRLVRGMQKGTRLEKGEKYYVGIVVYPKPSASSRLTDDPAEALRAIQEVDDEGA